MKPMHPLLKKVLLVWSVLSWIYVVVFAGMVLKNTLLTPIPVPAERTTLFQAVGFAWLVSGFVIGVWYIVRKFRKEETPYQLAVWIPFALAMLGIVGAVIAGLIVRFTF